ncbi:DUF4123 domain-containing protein [Massilia litorea]|uniref:DUF4123 domain-containing protein n=1 Tax=Massilia litorea TaxID=2769491 RepID=A0A7L9U784_9BURK|nr:DUF4123 domain-containing protein [Massilia litorea]QOL49906.1 DUF4123 domain-containing protein [Massilia litorea]
MNEPFNSQTVRQYAFAVADAGMAECLPDGLIVERLVPNHLGPSAHLMPILIDLNRSASYALDGISNQIRNACENAQAPCITLFIKTKASAREITRHWNSMQLVRPRPGHGLWLRLHDSRVLHQMLRILNPMQSRKMFGLSLAITYWIGGEWVTAERELHYPPGSQSSALGGAEPYAGQERWDWARIERIGLVNRALHHANIRAAAALTSAGALAEELMERAARRYGLIDNADLVEFAARGLRTNPTFDEHPTVARVIKQDAMSAEESSLSDRFALVEEQVWHALCKPTKTPLESQL